MILLLKNKYITDDVWEFCIEREPSLFKYMENPSLQVCYFALDQDGHNLKYIKNKFTEIKINRKMAYIAIRNCPKAIFYVPKTLLDDELKELAFEQDPTLMESFDNVRPEFVEGLLLRNPSYIKFIKNPDEALVCKLLKDYPNIIVYFSTITNRMRETLEMYHPEILNLIPIQSTENSAN